MLEVVAGSASFLHMLDALGKLEKLPEMVALTDTTTRAAAIDKLKLDLKTAAEKKEGAGASAPDHTDDRVPSASYNGQDGEESCSDDDDCWGDEEEMETEAEQPSRSSQSVTALLPATGITPSTAEQQQQKIVRKAIQAVFKAVDGDSTTVGDLTAEINRTNPGVLNAAEVDVVLKVLAEENAIMQVDEQIILI